MKRYVLATLLLDLDPELEQQARQAIYDLAGHQLIATPHAGAIIDDVIAVSQLQERGDD